MSVHIPVMAQEVLQIYAEQIHAEASLLFIDATLGAAGHASMVLERFPDSLLIGFDQDAQARALAETRLAQFGDRFYIVPENFREISSARIDDCLRAARFSGKTTGVHGIMFDLGVSNMQLTTPERGFSFQDDGPLDMRMDPAGEFPSARELLETQSVKELTGIFREYGEERFAYQIARAIVRARERGELFENTADLVALIRRTLPAPVQRKMGGHPARRIFQALRIAVNAELDVLVEGLKGAREVCADGGVIVVISYHSLEDRIVKRTFLKWAEEGLGKVLTRRPLLPTEAETENNRSSRSAKLRAFIATQGRVTS